ncbi:myb/SANT-like DNA-binding domain-containing protein 4 isoform X2 [Chanos chanos]|uniref:Myb/SANT-like DNA-binding domain-containing protein 4 n=1 Tax=Chanos chanos TaxID=29144 RepID=A0A6J2VJV2_CHACN|nr:myb/SANT-like DNA-binding domain-containing protein 4 isoform X2 [Chanos chanos]
MDFLQMKQHLKRKRKSNYSVKETQTLIREIHKRRDILFSRQQNTAINELKRRAWDEVADCVNALGEGELRTAAEVKRRYLDWRALMKRKQLRAESASGLKSEYEPSSPDNEASLSGGDQSLDLSGFSKDSACDWQDLADLGEASGHPHGVKMEEDEAKGGEGEGEEDDEDCFPSILPDMDREGRVPEVFAHIDEFGVLSSSKAACDSTALLVALEKQRLDLEKHRLQVESERLQIEKERLLLEKERMRQVEVERERLALEKEKLQLERERLPATTPTTSAPSSSSSLDGEKDRKPLWPMAVDLEAEKLKLEKERLLLEKERLQFFKFESGRLQIEKERLQVEKERLQLHKDGQQMALHPGH